MTDRPIIFSAPMIRALLEGRKTQTRRVLKTLRKRGQISEFGPSESRPQYDWTFRDGGKRWHDVTSARLAELLPYADGDRLWVREKWTASGTGLWTIADARRQMAHDQKLHYAADGEDLKWWPSIHMPREFSRVTLIITGVKVERLQDISAADAEAEGVEWESADPPFYYVPSIFPHSLTAVGVEEPGRLPHAVRSYAKLWSIINGLNSWDANPWVVAISFRVIRANIDSAEARTS